LIKIDEVNPAGFLLTPKKVPYLSVGGSIESRKVEDPFNPSEKSRTSTDHGDISFPYENELMTIPQYGGFHSHWGTQARWVVEKRENPG